jgi:hypothetical protein
MTMLDYERMILLDAEDLAEGGIKAAYDGLMDSLREYVRNPKAIEESFDSELPAYAVSSGGALYEIYSPDTPMARSWGNATYALFDIINRQLDHCVCRFYAINGGNDLGGLFLTSDQYNAAVRSLGRKADWPYIPTQDFPWFGQPH